MYDNFNNWWAASLIVFKSLNLTILWLRFTLYSWQEKCFGHCTNTISSKLKKLLGTRDDGEAGPSNAARDPPCMGGVVSSHVSSMALTLIPGTMNANGLIALSCVDESLLFFVHVKMWTTLHCLCYTVIFLFISYGM